MTADSKKPKWSALTFAQIEKRRKELDLPKSAMAAALGITNSTFHNWQRGKTTPHIAQQEMVKSVLDTLTAPPSASGDSPKPKAPRRAASVDRASSHRQTNGTRHPERTRGARETGAGEKHLMQDSFPMTHPFFLAPGQSVPGTDLPGIATITAAFISSQAVPLSAGSVLDFVTGLQKVLRPEQPSVPAKADEAIVEPTVEPTVEAPAEAATT